jgi:spore germination protein KC
MGPSPAFLTGKVIFVIKHCQWRLIFAVVVVCCCSGLLAGCWDYQELENRAIIVGLGIDELPPIRLDGKEMRMYQIVVQVVEPTAGGGEIGAGLGAKSTEQQGYTNFVIQSPSIAEGIERIVTRSDHMPNLSHLQLIGLGENVSRKGINDLYDFITRFPQMRRQTEMVVVTGPIVPFFTTPSVSEPTPALHMADMVDAVQKTLFMPETNLGTVSKSVRANTPFLLLKAALDGKKIVIDQAAVFEKFKMTGTISKNEMQWLSILHDEIERGFLHFPCSGGKRAGVQILAGKSKVKPVKRNGHPHIAFEVSLDSELVEYHCLGASFDKPDQIKQTERLFSRVLKERLLKTIEQLRSKYHSDLFRLTTRLKNHPELYKEIRERPKEFFQRMTVSVNVKVKIRHMGNVLITPGREMRP